jgi:NADPH:quinone reductase-like Zn-dependent oxidoreductase
VKAIVFRRYGGPEALRLEELAAPAPAQGEARVEVRAASLNPLDWRMLRGEPYVMRPGTGWLKPKRIHLGADVAGVVDAVGPGVSGLQPGDAVFGAAERLGSLAEQVCVPVAALVPKPQALSFEEAAAFPVAGLTAVQGLKDAGGVRPGSRVLINGASGGVGTFAIQVAKAQGARVTAVCSARNAELVRSLGADEVIDYAATDFTRAAGAYDLLFDAVGDRPLGELRRAVKPDGAYVLIGVPSGRWIAPLWPLARVSLAAPFAKQKLVFCMSRANQEDLLALKSLVESGKVKPVIDRTCTLEEVPEALRYLESHRARGKVVVRVA